MRNVTVARFHQIPHINEYGTAELTLKQGLTKGKEVSMSIDGSFLSVRVKKGSGYAETLVPLTNVVCVYVDSEEPKAAAKK